MIYILTNIVVNCLDEDIDAHYSATISSEMGMPVGAIALVTEHLFTWTCRYYVHSIFLDSLNTRLQNFISPPDPLLTILYLAETQYSNKGACIQ